MNINKLLKAKRVILEHIEDKISPKLGYKFMKFCKSIDAEEEFFDGRMSEILSNYCKRDHDGKYVRGDNGGYEIKEDKIVDCNRAVEELNSLEVEKPNFSFTVEELCEIKLSVADLMYLDEFLIE